jgi:hypothetical protein
MIGRGEGFPDEIRFGDAGWDNTLGVEWREWSKRSSLLGLVRRLSPVAFADVMFCLLSCAGMYVAGDTSDKEHNKIVGVGLAYITGTRDSGCELAFSEVRYCGVNRTEAGMRCAVWGVGYA